MLPIYIPSKSRYNVPIEVGKCTVASLSPKQREFTTVVCPVDEFDHYSFMFKGTGISLWATDATGIDAVRLVCGQVADGYGHKKFVMMDDDIEFYYRPDPTRYNLVGAEQEIVDEILSTVERNLETYAHVGISGREGNNRVMEESVDNTRMIRVLAYQTEAFLSCEHGRVPVMEDFDVTLQLMRKGYANNVMYHAAQGQKMTNAPGGCSTYRNHQMQDEAARKLAELHPGFVNLRQKKNKTDASGFGTRTEVTVYWKKAFMSSSK